MMLQNAVAIAVVAVLVIPGAWWVSHTRLVAARNDVEASWSDVDVELERRHVLVPRLVAVVERTAAHERTLLVELARRNDAAVAAPHTAEAANRLEPPLRTALSRVVALRERYPDLDAQRAFLDLQEELATTEDRIAAARRFYNTRVEALNRRIEAFPSAIVARRHGFAKAAFFDA